MLRSLCLCEERIAESESQYEYLDAFRSSLIFHSTLWQRTNVADMLKLFWLGMCLDHYFFAGKATSASNLVLVESPSAARRIIFTFLSLDCGILRSRISQETPLTASCQILPNPGKSRYNALMWDRHKFQTCAAAAGVSAGAPPLSDTCVTPLRI